MNIRDTLSLVGAACLAVGPIMVTNAPNQGCWYVGLILSALGGVLTGARVLPPTK